jgi:Fur family ferric uptake transcriptional regulator
MSMKFCTPKMTTKARPIRQFKGQLKGHSKVRPKHGRVLPCGRQLAPEPPPPSKAKLEEWQKRLRDFLTAQNLKYTEQRWSIAKLILETGGHLDAQQIVDNVKHAYPEIGAATVYRSIKVLCDAHLLEKSHQDVEGRVLYELPDEEHHDHIICLDCGEIFEFHDDTIENLQIRVAEKLGFKLRGHRHVIHGSCTYLEAKKKNKNGES